MPKQNRSTLKSFFGDGAVPTSSSFCDLIDSSINLNDDRFEKNSRDGVKISSYADSKVLTSYYDEQKRDQAVWRIAFDGVDNNLVWQSEADEQAGMEIDPVNQQRLKEALCLSRENNELRIGVGTKRPTSTLDVNGCVHLSERRGTYGHSFRSVPADGQWYTIADNIKGGSAFEVVARAQNPEKRRYAIIHAIAVHCPWRSKKNDFLSWFGLRNRIRYTQAFHDSLLHRIKLRWRDDDAKNGYQLQIRTNCTYGSSRLGGEKHADTQMSVLDFHITRLWNDNDGFTSLAQQAQGDLSDE